MEDRIVVTLDHKTKQDFKNAIKRSETPLTLSYIVRKAITEFITRSNTSGPKRRGRPRKTAQSLPQ